VDNAALASALQSGDIGAAGLDVFETEPLPASHPLRMCENALLTPHIAWYSSGSIARLQQLAAEEVVRALRGEALRCPVSAQ
jgi:phosphoglycerate dehydrogenase-like enzyme